MGQVIDARTIFYAEKEYNVWQRWLKYEDYYIKEHTKLRDEFVRNGNLPEEAHRLADITVQMAYDARQRAELPDNVVDHPRKNLYVSGGFKA